MSHKIPVEIKVIEKRAMTWAIDIDSQEVGEYLWIRAYFGEVLIRLRLL